MKSSQMKTLDNKIGIFGSGFGLYGYLPAAVSITGEKICLPLRYYEKFLQRDELLEFSERINWIDDDMTLINSVDILINARRPVDNIKLLEQITNLKKRPSILFEKPLGPCPESSRKMLVTAEKNNINISVGYIFKYTRWSDILKFEIQSSQTAYYKSKYYNINWEFKAHHYINPNNSWKSDFTQGGGAIRFFGIHLIAQLTELGYDEVSDQELTLDKSDNPCFFAIFKGTGLPELRVNVNSYSINHNFSISRSDNTVIINSKDPFDLKYPNNISNQDRRCVFLEALIRDIQGQHETDFRKLYKINILWSKVESFFSRNS